jgi:hypothetical protein
MVKRNSISMVPGVLLGGVATSRPGWAALLTLLAARTLLALLAQSLVTLGLAWAGHPDPARAGTAWWQVTGTLVDVGCLGLLYWLTRREGIRLVDLLGLDRRKLLRDLALGLGLLLVLFPVVMLGGSVGAGLLIYGTPQPTLPGEVMLKTLPLWGVLYSRLVWWVIWSPTEEMLYNGYALPRLMALTGRRWLAVAIVGVAWALQHAFLPLMADWRLFMYLFVQMLPLVIVMQILFLRLRRLPPLIVMHWGMDLISSLLMTAATA